MSQKIDLSKAYTPLFVTQKRSSLFSISTVMMKVKGEEVTLIASEVQPEFTYCHREILNNLEDFKAYLHQLHQTIYLKEKRVEAHIYLTEHIEQDQDHRTIHVKGEGEVLAILRIVFENEEMGSLAQVVKETLLRAKGDVRMTALQLIPGTYDVSYPFHFLIVL